MPRVPRPRGSLVRVVCEEHEETHPCGEGRSCKDRHKTHVEGMGTPRPPSFGPFQPGSLGQILKQLLVLCVEGWHLVSCVYQLQRWAQKVSGQCVLKAGAAMAVLFRKQYRLLEVLERLRPSTGVRHQQMLTWLWSAHEHTPSSCMHANACKPQAPQAQHGASSACFLDSEPVTPLEGLLKRRVAQPKCSRRQPAIHSMFAHKCLSYAHWGVGLCTFHHTRAQRRLEEAHVHTQSYHQLSPQHLPWKPEPYSKEKRMTCKTAACTADLQRKLSALPIPAGLHCPPALRHILAMKFNTCFEREWR